MFKQEKSPALLLCFISALVLAGLAPRSSVAQEKSDQKPSVESPATAAPIQRSGGESRGSVSANPEGEPRIGPGDELDLSVYGSPDLTQRVRVGGDGKIYVLLLGYVPVAGLTSAQTQALLERQLMEGGFFKHPHVTVYVKDYMNDGVTVTGEVNKPGVYPILGSRSLVEVLLAAGGLSPKAGNTVIITHRDRPQEPVRVKVGNNLQSMENMVQVLPGDAVVVPKGDIFYLLGGINQPGGYVMPDNGIKLLEAVAKAAGPARGVSLNKTKIIRKKADGLEEINVPLKSIMQGKTPDFSLQPDDIVYLPTGEHVGRNTILSLASYALIFRP